MTRKGPASRPKLGRAELDPMDPDGWQTGVDLSAALLKYVEVATVDGLVVGKPDVDVEACRGILEMGRELGIRPRADAIEHHLARWRDETCQ